jgi:hypothetical protein
MTDYNSRTSQVDLTDRLITSKAVVHLSRRTTAGRILRHRISRITDRNHRQGIRFRTADQGSSAFVHRILTVLTRALTGIHSRIPFCRHSDPSRNTTIWDACPGCCAKCRPAPDLRPAITDPVIISSSSNLPYRSSAKTRWSREYLYLFIAVHVYKLYPV